MLKWFSNEGGESGAGGPDCPPSGEVDVAEMAERLVQTEQLITQLKEMIREKDATLRTKDEQLKMEKETCEAKLSKLRLQNKAKVTSLTTQLEEVKKQMGGQVTPTHGKKAPSEGGEQASRGKIVLLKKKVEELEQHLAQSEKELENKRREVEAQRQRGEEMDVMLTDKDKKLSEKEAYIIHLQTSMAGNTSAQQKVDEDHGTMQELQMLVQSLTKKVGEAEERYSLLQEQTDSLKELLVTEKEQYSQKENMYKQNIQTFKEIILQKDHQITEINQMHEQELFKLAATSDASADLQQLLKALKQKLHEKEEVLLGKTQVIDVLQKEVDGRDQQIKELTERMRRLHVERESLESKMEAEKHVMRAQLRDLIEKHQGEVRRMTEQHQSQLSETQQDLLGQLEQLRNAAVAPWTSQEAPTTDPTTVQRIAELEAQTKQKIDEASKSEAKFLKMKAWSKSRIRQLEEELKKSQAGIAPPDLTALRSRVTALEEEREEYLWKVEQYEELKAKNDMLEAKLVVYEEQQRTLQADLEQFTKRAASQASESGSADDTQSQVLEWQEMVAEAVNARDHAREEKAAMVLRISHMEEEREALATRQQELEEELAQARGLSQHGGKKLAEPAQRSLQEDFEFDGQGLFQEPRHTSESTTPMEGENMGDGLRSVVEELELERNQLQEQILSLEERCQDLEDRLQLQARIEALQNEYEKLQSQFASVRSQHSREAEKHQLLVSRLNEQLKGMSDTQECLESSLIEKENTLAKTSEKLELINSLRESLSEKEIQYKEMSDKLLQTEQTLEKVSKKSSISEKHCSELKGEVCDLTQKLNGLRDKTQKQDITIETLQTEFEQTNEELDKLNTSHLEERAQLIHDLQSCEREIDSLKDILSAKDKEISALNGSVLEYTEQVTILKQDLRLKEETLLQVENALTKAEREARILHDSQTSDQQVLNSKIAELVENLKSVEVELDKTKEESKSKVDEMNHLRKQAKDDKKAIQHLQDLQADAQKQILSHRSQLSECEKVISSLKEQLTLSTQRQLESEEVIVQLKNINTNNEKNAMREEIYEKELKTLKDEKNKLLSQLEKYSHDMELLSQELKERAQIADSVKQEMEKKMEIITSLENQIRANDIQAEDERQRINSELQVRDSENQKLCKEIDVKTENISKMENTLKHVEAQKEQLQAKLRRLTEELELQNLNGQQLTEKMTAALELNSSLEKQVQSVTEENERLKVEVTFERDSLHNKLTTIQLQHSQNDIIIQALQKQKEHLILQTNELKRDAEQSTLSHSEVLLAKTNECDHLNQLLGEKENFIAHLQGELQSYIAKVDELQHTVEQRQQLASVLKEELETQRNEQTQLQQTLSLLQEQDCSLKSGLMEKDANLKEKQDECHSLQNEIILHRNSVSELQVNVESLSAELSLLCKKLEEREQQCQKQKDDLDDATQTIKSLNDKINEIQELSRKSESEAVSKETELRTLQSEIDSIVEQKKDLDAACKSRENQLEEQIQIVSNLDKQLKVTLEQNSSFSMKITSLTEDNQQLQEKLSQNHSLASELTTKNNLLQKQKSELEVHILNNQREMNDVLNEKDKLIVAVSNMKQVLKENEMSNKQKTEEFSSLSRTLRDREQQLQNLQEQVSQQSLLLVEKEQILLDRNCQLDTQQNQQLQLQDTISMLKEQGSVLKSGLMERDTMLQQKSEECIVYQNEVILQKGLVSQIQCEIESLTQECFDAKQQLVQKEQMLKDLTNDFEHQKNELNKRSESVISLGSQIGAMNESFADMEIEMTSLKDAVEKLTSEKCQLTQEKDRGNAEIVDLKDAIQALTDQNMRFQSEIEKSFPELSKAHKDLTDLKTTLSDRELQVKTLQSEMEQLHFATQEKDNYVKQQEHAIQQLNSRISEQEGLLKQKDDETFSLRIQVTELIGQVETITSESTALKYTVEKKEQASLEDGKKFSLITENLNAKFQDKEKECESLKEQISHVEESVLKINSTLQTQREETENLKKALEEKELNLMAQSQSFEDLQRRADESLLFKSQFMESTELLSQLQSQIQTLSSDSENHRKSAEETQSAFINLQEKYAANLEDLQDVRKQLSQRTDEVLTLRKLSDDTNCEHKRAQTAIETLKDELSTIQHKLEQTQDLNSQLSKEKEEAFSSHQARVSLLTLEIERLKTQHLQVVAQMNALTENLEQREMALHAINSQCTAQAKHTSQMISEIQKLELQNKKLIEEIQLSKEEHQCSLTTVNNENTHLVNNIRKLLAEKEELERRHHETGASQGELMAHMEQQSRSMSESIEKMLSEKESLQAKVSVQDEEISQLRENLHKAEHILQDSEKEWLLVLDREKQDKILLAEQLSHVEKEREERDHENGHLQQAIKAVAHELELLLRKNSGTVLSPIATLSGDRSHLHHMIKQVEASHQSEVDALTKMFDSTRADLQKVKSTLDHCEVEKCQEIENLQSQLKIEVEKVTEAILENSSLHDELKAKDNQINCMSIQISQQKDLLGGLSQQLKDKDASISQVMEAALNERVKLGEEKAHLSKQLASVEKDYHASTKQYEDISRQLEEHVSCSLKENEIQASEKLELVKENSELKFELSKVSEEKDMVKKKLKASLFLRKDLLKKIEELEKQNEESINEDISVLQNKLLEKTKQAQSVAEMYEDRVSFLEKECLDKVNEVRDHTMQLQSENNTLQATLSEKEMCLSEMLQSLNEKSALIKQLKAVAAEREDNFEQDKKSMMQKMEMLESEIEAYKTQLKDKYVSNNTAVELENELTQMKQEKAMLQKKTQAALLARKETMKKAQESEKSLTKELSELKDEYKAVLEQHCQQTKELNVVQLELNEKLSELEELQKTLSSYSDELETLRQLVQERDQTVQDLNISLAEKENQCHSLSNLQTELVTMKAQFESFKKESEDKTLVSTEKKAEMSNSNLHVAQSALEEAQKAVKEQREMATKYQKQLKDSPGTSEIKHQNSMEENKTLLEQVAEIQQHLSEKESSLTNSLEKEQLDCTGEGTNVESLKQENENSVRIIAELRGELAMLHLQLHRCKNAREPFHEDTPESAIKQEHVTQDEVSLVYRRTRDSKATPNQNDESEISARDDLTLTLQQQSKSHVMANTNMKREVDELHKAQEDCDRVNDQQNYNKTTQLSRKLQAALISRRELLKENASLKEQVENLSDKVINLSDKVSTKEAECLTLESSFSSLKQQNIDLESSIKNVNMDKEKLSSEVDRILNDNCNLSDACESLKQTIENITQQKQAFSCQLESLKDSQTEELTKWKSKHSELKQDYESLLQAYENVGTEMDKMRQLLEGAKRERQEALGKLHKCETEMKTLQDQARQLEAEHERLKEKMYTFSEEKRQDTEDMAQANEKMRRLSEMSENYRMAMTDLTNKNQHLVAELLQLKSVSEGYKNELTEMQAENRELTEKLQEATCSSEKHCLESRSFTEDMQLKLDQSLSLNNSLVESQKTQHGAQLESNNLLQNKERTEISYSDHEIQLTAKDDTINNLKEIVSQHSQETISLIEKVKILEDDKCLLQEELENIQEISDKVKNENDYLETVILKNSKKIDELSESISVLQAQNMQICSQLTTSKDMYSQLYQEKEDEHLKLVGELEEKLKTMQRGRDGSKSVSKELQELLKEKHQEINYLQQNCIKYQEHVLHLESALKTSESACENLENDWKKLSEKMFAVEEKNKHLEADLTTSEAHLQEAKEKMEKLECQRNHLKLALENVKSEKTKVKEDSEKHVNSFSGNEVMLQKQIDDLQDSNNHESQTVAELKQQIDSQHLKINTLKRALETNEVKLDALSSSPQGANTTKLWNDLYQKSLHEKDNQLNEQGSAIKRLREDLQMSKKEVNELAMTKSRLEKALNDYSVASAAHQRQVLVLSASNAEFAETVKLLTLQVKELSAQIEGVNQDRNDLKMHIADKEDKISQLHFHCEQTEKLNGDLESQLRLLQSQNDNIFAKLEKQNGISLQLKTLLQSKNVEISTLLTCRDGHMSGYLEQLLANYRSQEAVYEDRLTSLHNQREKADKKFRELEAKVRSMTINLNRSVQENEQLAAKMVVVKTSMVSLQREKERLMSEYRILEVKNQAELKNKADSPDSEGFSTKDLKHEVKKLLHQMDDLNSENAMLRAQLIRYREDLNQVLSLKDSQLKVLLKKQQDVINNLEDQKTAAEKECKVSQSDLQKAENVSSTLKTEISKLKLQVTQLQSDIVSQKATNEGKVIADLQQAVAAKAAECNDLQQKVVSQKSQIDDLNAKMQLLEKETDKKLSDADDKYNSELHALERELELVRNERETADQRLTELAQDLLEMEQQLSLAQVQNKDMKDQNESLCKAMAALQNNRDQLIEDFKVLRNRYDEELRETRIALNKVERNLQDATSDLAMITKERDIIVQKLRALERKDSHKELNKLLEDLSKALSEKEKQLTKVVLENSTYTRQLSAFSKSMASLQNDRDRLVYELEGATREVESRQKSGLDIVSTLNVEKSKGSAFQIEKDGAMNEQLPALSPRKEDSSSQEKNTNKRFERDTQQIKETVNITSHSGTDEAVRQLEAERVHLHKELQLCLYEIQKRDQYFQQLNSKLQQSMEEKGAVAAQLRVVSQNLRDSQNRCHLLETQIQGQGQGSGNAEVAPGAPHERSNNIVHSQRTEDSLLRERLLEVEQSLADERSRREAAEEALHLAEVSTKSLSRDHQRDFSIEMEAEDEWEAVSLNPNQPLITRRVKGGMMACRRWVRGRSLYLSRLLTGRVRSRYFFLAYLLTIHVLLLMCFTGAL
ncbi:golgin subfamily B member 1 isoform X2 [Dunckerocampus dactyliophorus]|uniref:golgin subfamily B member 1 isoform X2 n=1 Tax=Dunckerocampus dactyliophorus TaxID=161453 RepID=UPI0024051866|nr:golgin subfamily B member 1 isoform X2 [Dunckerocampus dactyliophorus]